MRRLRVALYLVRLAQEVFDYHDGPPWYAAPKNAAKKPLSPKSPKKKAKKAD